MELNLKNLAPLLQCTSINRCALFITSKRKKYYFIKFLSPLLLKKYFFLFLFLSLSGFSSFFLFQSSILIRPASLLNSLLRSLAPTTPHCPVPTEVQLVRCSEAQRRPLLTAQRRSKPSLAPTTPHYPASTEIKPVRCSEAQRQPLLIVQRRSKPCPAPTTLCVLHLKGRTSKLHPLSTTSCPAPMWVSVCVFRSVLGKWACVCVCGSGLVLVVGFLFFIFCLLWTAGSGGGGGGGSGACG